MNDVHPAVYWTWAALTVLVLLRYWQMDRRTSRDHAMRQHPSHPDRQARTSNWDLIDRQLRGWRGDER